MADSGRTELFVDKHQVQLIQRVANITPILDELLLHGAISKESYEDIKSIPTSQGKVRALIHGSVRASGVQGKQLFYELLKKYEPYLISDLRLVSEKVVEKEVTMTPPTEKLLETLEDLSYRELVEFKWFLQRTGREKGLQRISKQRIETSDRHELVEMMVKVYGQQSVEVTREVLMEMGRTDLVQSLSETSSGSQDSYVSSQDPARTVGLCYGSSMEDSSEWILLEPEMNCADEDEAPTYSLQSEAGRFECGVSGLRWVCKEKVSLKYQFCSLKEHMERIERIQYMPAGPLMNITVTAGKLDEVYLPHWICIVDNPTILDKFAVLHIDDCGDFVEKASEVTSSHVKLSEPVFSLKMILVKVGFSVEINSKILIYKTNTAFLTLHVYLIPPDHGLKQELDKIELAGKYKRIRKPHPTRPLKMNDWFFLTAVLDVAELSSDKHKPLTYDSIEPNFHELFIEKPETDFTLKLTHVKELQPVWSYVIKKEEYQSTGGHEQEEHFVDKHRAQLIDRVDNIASILDELLNSKVIQQAVYDEIRAISDNREKMRRLYSGPLNAAGVPGKGIFYSILEKKQPLLVADLKIKKCMPW